MMRLNIFDIIHYLDSRNITPVYVSELPGNYSIGYPSSSRPNKGRIFLCISSQLNMK